jgi:hypothetical protein
LAEVNMFIVQDGKRFEMAQPVRHDGDASGRAASFLVSRFLFLVPRLGCRLADTQVRRGIVYQFHTAAAVAATSSQRRVAEFTLRETGGETVRGYPRRFDDSISSEGGGRRDRRL